MNGKEDGCSEQLQTQANFAGFDHFDAESSNILAIAKADKELYVLSEESFECSFIQGFVASCIQNSSIFSCNAEPCYVCPLAKQQPLMFNKSCDHSTVLFDLVHIDLWGPYKVATLQDTKYFLTLVEDSSRSTWTLLLSSKVQVLSAVKSFFNMVKK
ncbi:hypothetical protein LIER_10174 [Lithospermum erythrorhizon]|uniref:Uncharacterized protein n=1 Tax=Lithospermum erythrorhizon TaxID=34254 RepID=A0AAV3PMB5_LITER